MASPIDLAHSWFASVKEIGGQCTKKLETIIPKKAGKGHILNWTLQLNFQTICRFVPAGSEATHRQRHRQHRLFRRIARRNVAFSAAVHQVPLHPHLRRRLLPGLLVNAGIIRQ